MGTLKAGVGTALITPPVGIEMGAWALRRGFSQGVHDDMQARALVLSDGETAVAIVSLDVVNISEEITDKVREIVAEQVPIPEGNILLNCSHTHTTPHTGMKSVPTGPEVSESYYRGTAVSPGHVAYLRSFPYYVAGAIIEAWHNMDDAAIGAASTTVEGITVNRRDPVLPVDPQLGVIRVDDAMGQPLACLANYACHGTSVGAHYLYWTADFAGYLSRAIEDAQLGCTGMFLQGAEGDIHPWDWYFGNPNPRFGDTYEAAERLGKAIAGPALGLLSQIQTESSATIRVAEKTVPLPPRPIKWTAEEAEQYLAHVEATAKPHTGDVIPDRCPGCMSAQRFPDNYLLTGARHEAEFARNYPESIETRLAVIRINDILLAANSGELFSALGMQIKQDSPVEHTFVLSCTNGRVGYIPVRDAAEAVLDLSLEDFVDPVKNRRHYGATITTEIGPDGGEIVVEETLRLIAATS